MRKLCKNTSIALLRKVKLKINLIATLLTNLKKQNPFAKERFMYINEHSKSDVDMKKVLFDKAEKNTKEHLTSTLTLRPLRTYSSPR